VLSCATLGGVGVHSYAEKPIDVPFDSLVKGRPIAAHAKSVTHRIELNMVIETHKAAGIMHNTTASMMAFFRATIMDERHESP
jgi:hypothetical protein